MARSQGYRGHQRFGAESPDEPRLNAPLETQSCWIPRLRAASGGAACEHRFGGARGRAAERAPAAVTRDQPSGSTKIPQARRQRAAAWLSRLHRRLTRARGHKAIAWARFPDGESTPDELRLRVVPPKSVDGFLGVEVAYQESAEHNDATACLMLRAKEGSIAQQIGRGQLVWQRGRRADEKVAIYPLDWPSCSLAEDIIVEMLGEFASCKDSEVRKPSARGKPVKASARGAGAVKRGTGSLPPRVTRRA